MSTWKFGGTGDFLGDGKDQYIVENTSGLVAIGEVVSGQPTYIYPTALPAGWSFVETGDFLGAGKSDFLVQNTATGSLAVGEVANGVAGFTFLPQGLDATWKFVGSGDFLGDGKDQFLVENTSGLVAIGEIAGGQATYIYPTALAAQWKFVGVGDYLGEGHDQFLIDNTTTNALFVGDYSGGQVHYTQVGNVSAAVWLFH